MKPTSFALGTFLLAAVSVSAAPCTNMNDLCLDLLMQMEGFHSQPYTEDGVTQIDMAITARRLHVSSELSLPLTSSSAAALLNTDLIPIFNCINISMNNSTFPLTDMEQGGLASWGYSIGCEAVIESDMMQKLSEGESPTRVFADESPKYPAPSHRRDVGALMLHTGSNVQAYPECFSAQNSLFLTSTVFARSDRPRMLEEGLPSQRLPK
ncbi:hypothetical protein EV426DRAFT_664113 [Tirmania nivea]|nr:hypothetical protein EV426DRAFT_664113 [Tirmania nivea]